MSTIPLRDYCQKIESLIDIGNNDEAIFHALSILNVYPKLTIVYRSLGQALLELKRYQESSEVFSKVLSVFPDDFISHVGLSAIKENDLDLDKAIWHMEQAFDMQPSNVVVQEELRRLLGRRDGVSPNKIRLSRGALIRMYLKGELYQQAISEIHSFQKNDPGRVDLDVILAKIYTMTGRLEEASEISSRVVQQLPYCYEANKILAIHGDPSEKNTYRSRLTEIDPYNQFVGEHYQTAEEVPAENILVEEEIYSSPEQENTAIPDWARNVGLNWVEEPVASNQSDSFINEGSDERVSPFTIESAPQPLEEIRQDSETSNDGSLPDWMKNAGWTKESGATDPINEHGNEDAFPEPFLQAASQDAAEPVESLPEWMKDIQSDEETVLPLEAENNFEIQDNPVTDFDKATLDWSPLENTQSDTTSFPSFEEPGEPFPEPEEKAEPVELPDWLKNYEVDVSQSEVSATEEEKSTFVDEVPPFEEVNLQPSDSEPIPDNIIEDADVEVNSFQLNPLDSTEVPEIETDASPSLSSEESVPDWVKKILGGSSITSALQESAIPQSTTVEDIEKDLVGFLENDDLRAEQRAETDKPDNEENDIPEFITELPNNPSSQGLLNEETNAELISWLDEVTAEDLDLSEEIAPQIKTTVNEDRSSIPELSLESLIEELDSLNSPEVESPYQEDFSENLESVPDIDDRLAGLLDTSENNTLVDNWLVSAENLDQNLTEETESTILNPPLEDFVQNLDPGISDQNDLPIEETLKDQFLDLEENNDIVTGSEPIEEPVLQTTIVEQIKRDLESDPNSYEKWQSLGDAHFRLEQIEAAIEAYVHAENILNNAVKE